MEPFTVSLAPSRLVQSINPWRFNFEGAQFGLFNIDLGQSSDPGLEREILDKVGSYGRQLGQIGDALAVLLDGLDREALKPAQRAAIERLSGQLAHIDQIKRERAKAAA